MKLRLAVSLLLPAVALAGPISNDSLHFDGLHVGEQVLNFYNGGFGGSGSGPGPNIGVSFTNGLAADSTVIAFGPSALVTAPTVTMNLADAWLGLFSFYFQGTGTISLYAGPNAGGGLVGTLPLTGQGPFGILAGFQSAVITPTVGTNLRVDSITFGFLVIPEPSSAMLFACGIAFMFWLKLQSKSRRLL
jgi:hypothetical protein